MPLNDGNLAMIDYALTACDGATSAHDLAAALRPRLPGVVVLACDAADVLEAPWRSYPGIDLHFVDTRNHCTAMTSDPAEATGLLLAARGDAA